MKKNNLIFVIVFTLLIFLGGILRFMKISNFPPSVNWDEISHGYNAYSILKTGSDEWGKLPIVNFKAYGDYPLPLNLYLTIPSISVFGLNEFSIRFPHMLLGFITIFSCFFLCFGITRRKDISILTSFLIAIGPWYFFPSRIVLQSNLSVFLLTTAMALFVNRKKRSFLLPLSFLLMFLTLFSYHSTRIFSPLLLIGLIFIYKKEFLKLLKQKKIVGIISLIIVTAFFIVIPIIFLNPYSRARTKWVFVVNEGAINKIIEQRQNSKYSNLVTRVLYNRPLYFVKEFSINYFEYFSPKFLFFKGGTQYQFSLQNNGLLYLVNLPFFYLGLVLLFKNALRKKEKIWKLLLFWLLIAPIPAAITSEKFAVLRSTTMLPIPEILTGIGFYWVYDLIKNKKLKYVLLAIYLLILSISFKNYYFKLSNVYSYNYSSSWQYGYKEVVDFVKENYSKYDKVIITKKYGEAHEFFLFFWPWDPRKYKSDINLIRFDQSNWSWVDRFDKFYFVNDWDIPESGNSFILESKSEVGCINVRCLLITESQKYPVGWKKIKSYNFLNGKEAFELYEN